MHSAFPLEPPPRTGRRPFIARFIRELNLRQDRTAHRLQKELLQREQQGQGEGREKFRKTRREVEIETDGMVASRRKEKLQGEAEITCQNGVVFKGNFLNGRPANGHLCFPNGFQFTGNCLGQTLSGHGELRFPSGKTIEGEWQNLTLQGKGKICYPSGEIYYGEIQNLKKHGLGHLFFNDGSKYVGEFEWGQISGNGTLYERGVAVASGFWVKGELQRMNRKCTEEEYMELSLGSEDELVGASRELRSRKKVRFA